jgi:phosphatidate cytidylyltransferase
MTSFEKTAAVARWEVRPLMWSLLIMLYLSAFIPNTTVALILFGFISFQSLKDYFTIVPLRRAERYWVLLSYLCIPLQLMLIGTHYHALALALIPLLIFALAAWLITHYETTAQALNSTLKIGWGLFTLVFGVSHLGLILVRNSGWESAAGQLEGAVSQGNPLLYLILLVHAQAIMQATLLRWRVNDWSRPVFNASLTGLAGVLSILGTGILAWGVGPWLSSLTPLKAMISGLLIGASAYLATTTVRTVQQALEITEADRHLPGQGGILLYIYPFAYAAPLFFYYVTLFA